LEDENTKETTRKVLTIWDVFAETGGFMEMVFMSISVLIFHYSNFNFNA